MTPRRLWTATHLATNLPRMVNRSTAAAVAPRQPTVLVAFKCSDDSCTFVFAEDTEPPQPSVPSAADYSVQATRRMTPVTSFAIEPEEPEHATAGSSRGIIDDEPRGDGHP